MKLNISEEEKLKEAGNILSIKHSNDEQSLGCDNLQFVPEHLRDVVVSSRKFTELVKMGDFEAIEQYLRDTNGKIIVWEDGDCEVIPKEFWVDYSFEQQECINKFMLLHIENQEYKFSVIYVMGDKLDFQMRPDALVAILEVLKHNKTEDSCDKTFSVLRDLYNIISSNPIVSDPSWGIEHEEGDSWVEPELYPIASSDYIYFDKNNRVQTTLFGADFDMEYQGIHIEGASKNFIRNIVEDGDLEDIELIYSPEEKNSNILSFFVQDKRVKKAFEELFEVNMCSDWDDVL